MSGVVTFKVDKDQVLRTLSHVPRLGYFWIRNYLKLITLDQRKTWLRIKGTKFERARSDGSGILVSRLNEGNVPPKDNEVAFQVTPLAERMPSGAEAKAGLDVLRADIFTGNKILPVHEFGTDIDTNRYMAVPYKTRPGDIHEWKRRNPNAKLITMPSKKDGKKLVYETQHKARFRSFSKTTLKKLGPRFGLRLAPAPQLAPVRFQKLRLRWVLTKHVDMKPTLKLFEAWEGLKGPRDKHWADTANRLAADIAAGKEN